MPKYRLLSIEELNDLEKEFIQYLILNGITADDWTNILENDSEKSEEIIDLFSDVVFEGILRKAQFLEKREAKELRVLQCLDEKMVLVGLSASTISSADLTNEHYLKSAQKSPPLGLKVFRKDIIYEQSREKEIFELTEKGYHISDGSLFKTLCLLLAENSSSL